MSETLAYRVAADWYCLACGVPEHKPTMGVRSTPCGLRVAVEPVIIDRVVDAAEIAGRRCHTCGEELRA